MNEPSVDMRLVRELADGRFHSRERLAERLSLSRDAFTEHVRALESLGLKVQAVNGEGVRLQQGIELLNENSIRLQLGENADAQLDGFELYLHTDSTNQRLLERPPPKAGKVHVCLAEFQASGRGRMGRRWQAPFGSGVCLSVSRVFANPGDAFSALGLAVGVAIAEALALCGLPDVMLKWPNDITWQGRKLGGVLIESRGEAGGPLKVVIGVGINYSLDADTRRGIEASAKLPPADVLSISPGRAPGRNRLAAALIEGLLPTLRSFEERGFAPFAEKWRRADMLADRLVSVSAGEESVTGIARGIDHTGALLVEVADTQRRFVSGEASLTRIEEPVGQ